MGLFNRGQSISGMWLDGKPAIRAYLGDVLVWDGTMPAFVNVPRALASALAVAPTVRADASITAVYALGSSSAIAPSPTAFATVDPETAVIVTAQVSAPAVRADSIIVVETITVGAQALPAVAAQSSAATVAAPAAVVSVATLTPSVAAHFATTVPAIAVNATAQVPVITATSAAVVNVPVSAVNATARVPAVSGSSSVGAFAVTADSSAKIPTMTASSTVSTPAATATGLAKNPAVTVSSLKVAGADKSGVQQLADSVWAAMDAAVVRAGFGDTVLSGASLVMSGSGSITVTGKMTLGGASSTNTKGFRILKNGTVIQTFTNTNNDRLAAGTTSSFSVATDDLISMEFYAATPWENDRTVQPGSTSTYFYTTLV
ncbi:hypothetical protein G9444_6744 (plasmid) [Rhodococcus erythropolis]|uniref:Uncharacterized protein n=1 Tax=Rhodococcus erythropolis TaxID=1833 RepID=A0A6G9D427_RHOER|nr:hypothetical protein [Rhodococcus erythropolis]QIP39724.1 hypothetical protein G9444_2480 [Rhodococcus erythropolis]QIP43987.1 hypothetical protein G9444_6744 [Rhodococcus erythropolis]